MEIPDDFLLAFCIRRMVVAVNKTLYQSIMHSFHVISHLIAFLFYCSHTFFFLGRVTFFVSLVDVATNTQINCLEALWTKI